LVAKPKYRDHVEDVEVDGRIILKLTTGNETSGSIKCGEGLHYVRTCYQAQLCSMELVLLLRNKYTKF
jgi:hypothetical protein